jgi:predicted nucleic acid-binding protein
VLINWFKNDPLTINILEKIGLSNIVIPSITVMEIYQGALNNRELGQLKNKIKNYKIVHFDKNVSELAVQ